jgi:hypothetical protein
VAVGVRAEHGLETERPAEFLTPKQVIMFKQRPRGGDERHPASRAENRRPDEIL